jgi:hypothetical protein
MPFDQESPEHSYLMRIQAAAEKQERNTMRHAARVDANQPKIVKFARDNGFTVSIVSMVPGLGFDILVGYRGIDEQWEIKDGTKSQSAQDLTDSEKKHLREWKGRLVQIVTCETDVLVRKYTIDKEVACSLKPWSVRLVTPDMQRHACTVVDIGHADRIITVECQDHIADGGKLVGPLLKE